MLFSNIAQLCAKNVTVTIQVSAVQDNKLEVVVTPTASTVSHALISKAFTATPQELDAHMPQVIAAYANSNGTLLDEIRSIEQDALAAAAKAKEEAAAKTTVRKAAPVKPKSAGAPALELDDGSDGPDGNDGSDDAMPATPVAAEAPAQLVL